jgi:hypothetical protein
MYHLRHSSRKCPRWFCSFGESRYRQRLKSEVQERMIVNEGSWGIVTVDHVEREGEERGTAGDLVSTVRGDWTSPVTLVTGSCSLALSEPG